MKKIPYLAAMIFLVALYLIGQNHLESDSFTNTVATILAIIAAVAFWLEFRSNERINEAQLVMSLNEQFISNEELSKVEWALEKYYIAYTEAKQNGGDVESIALDIEFDINDRARQSLVNYLVYLEGIATLVNEGVLHLNVITELMAYRYFIAVNNPIVQKQELIPYKAYYQGCYKLYEKWSKKLEKKLGGNALPLSDTPLVEPQK